MFTITLPNADRLDFHAPLPVLQIAEQISPSLAKAAIAAEFDGKLVDLSFLVDSDGVLRILTTRDSLALGIIRHSTAHLLAHAVKQLFPDAQVTIGPVIENGFYYDFSFYRPFTPDDLQAIEKRMEKLVDQRIPVERFVLTRAEAVALFGELGENYKVKIIENIPEQESLTLYRQGDFVDLCRGPHVPDTGKLKVFKLTHVAGAYWRGDVKNEMLQRIYGTAWHRKQDMDDYLAALVEAEKRDHRKLGKLTELFHIQEEAPGMVFWHPKGATLYQLIKNYLRERLADAGYQEIRTPQLLSRQLWERSGHWDKFFKEMFTTQVTEHSEFALKPMNCPGHILMFKQGLRSYKDLPLRLAEFGSCHRNEPSGSLHGLMRVRGFVQDDAHIFCTEEQIQSEVSKFIDLLYDVYADFGFNEVLLRVATRPEVSVGSDESWKKAEQALIEALKVKGLAWHYAPGEGAFYGPKIEFSLKDCLGRIWQCGTIQVDFSMPSRLQASYIDKDSERKTPIMLHRAILGSLERFIGILIEQYAGCFPVWLSPIQVVIMTITDKHASYAQKVAEELTAFGVRVKLDLRNEKIGFKIREHSLQKFPYLLILGDKEMISNQVSVRRQTGDDLGRLAVHDFYQLVQRDTIRRSRIAVEK